MHLTPGVCLYLQPLVAHLLFGGVASCCHYDMSGRLDCVSSYLRPVGSSVDLESRGLSLLHTRTHFVEKKIAPVD